MDKRIRDLVEQTPLVDTHEHLLEESALRQARAVAGGRDIRIAGGAHAILQYLNAGLVDELCIELSPVLLGAGIRLFDGVDPRRSSLDILKAIHSPMVTHLIYAARRR